MAVVNYYTVNGVLIGENSVKGSGFRSYKSDALGSIILTATPTGDVENTYRYKPYGATLAITGTATDPSFMWVGSLGYYQTTRTNSEIYVRERVYSTASRTWTTTDISEDRNKYVYGGSSPAQNVDATGTFSQSHQTQGHTTLGPCNCGNRGSHSEDHAYHSNIQTYTTSITVKISANGSISPPGFGITAGGGIEGTFPCQITFTHGDVVLTKDTYTCHCYGCNQCPPDPHCSWSHKRKVCRGSFYKTFILCPPPIGGPFVHEKFVPNPGQPSCPGSG